MRADNAGRDQSGSLLRATVQYFSVIPNLMVNLSPLMVVILKEDIYTESFIWAAGDILYSSSIVFMKNMSYSRRIASEMRNGVGEQLMSQAVSGLK